VAGAVIDLAISLSDQVAVLHDISDGGLAVAIAEICIASGIGATIEQDSAEDLFCEDPHRLVVVCDRGSVDLPEGLASRIGTMGGDIISFGNSGVTVAEADREWRTALERALGD
jgi:phosphoribosylformylglycinamidine synthase